MVDVSDDTAARMRAWAESHGAFFNADVVARPIPEMGGGYGCVALRDMPKGTMIATMTPQVMLTAARARKEYRLPRSVATIDAIVIFLANERLRARAAKAGSASASHWTPWIGYLPTRYDNCIEVEDAVAPGFIETHGPGRSAEDVARLEAVLLALYPIPRMREKVAEELANFHALADRVLSNVAGFFKPHAADADEVAIDDAADSAAPPAAAFVPNPADVTRELLRWAFNSLMSRGFGYSDETWVMLPYVDYFNYASTPSLSPSERARGFQFTTAAPVKAGEQLLATYGRYTDFELAMWYGFTLCCAAGPSSRSHHQANCAYIFSPLADTDGNYPEGAQWALTLLRRAGFTSLPMAYRGHVATIDVGSCRVSRKGCSPAMAELCRGAAATNETTPGTVLKRVAEAEVAAIEDAAPRAAAARASVQLPADLPLVAFAKTVAKDSAELIRHVAGLPVAVLDAWVEAEGMSDDSE